MRTKRILMIIGLAAVMIVLLLGCTPKSTAPGANSVGGTIGEAAYSYHYWDEGLAILLWHDFSYGGEGCSGSSSTEDPMYRLECVVEAKDGRRFGWNVQSSDGVTADLWIDGQKFDLDKGNLFLVSSASGEIEIEQFKRDFTGIGSSNAKIAALAESDADIAAFVNHLRAQSEPAVAPDIVDLNPDIARCRLSRHIDDDLGFQAALLS